MGGVGPGVLSEFFGLTGFHHYKVRGFWDIVTINRFHFSVFISNENFQRQG